MTYTVTLTHQPWLVASEDDLRRQLTCVSFEPCGVAVATDTVAMAIVPCCIEGDGFTGALVPASFLKEAYRQCPKGMPLTLTFLDGEVMAPTKKGGPLRISLVDGKFPNWRRLVPDVLAAAREPAAVLGLNPSRLTSLAVAIGSEPKSVVAFGAPTHENAPFLVLGTDGAFGLLMPYSAEKLSEDYAARFSAAHDLWQKGSGAPVVPVPKPRKAKQEKPAPPPVPEPEAPLVPAVPVVPSRPLPAWLAACLP